MKRKISFIFIAVISIVFLSSCKVNKEYVQYISKKEEIKTPATKKVVIFSTDDVRINEFTKTFEKNFKDKKAFTSSYLNDFKSKLKESSIYEEVFVDVNNTSYESISKSNADYIIYFANFEIANRVEWRNTGAMGMNGIGGMQTTSVEYCVINIKVEIYDTKSDKEIIDFIVIGEESVFLFDFTKTFNKAKERSINHIINYLKSGRTTYDKY